MAHCIEVRTEVSGTPGEVVLETCIAIECEHQLWANQNCSAAVKAVSSMPEGSIVWLLSCLCTLFDHNISQTL